MNRYSKINVNYGIRVYPVTSKGEDGMCKYFNVEGACNPVEHYMVALNKRLRQIKVLVDQGKYFSISRARQYGKTTTLGALEEYLHDDYIVIGMDFQLLSHDDFVNESAFIAAFSREILATVSGEKYIPEYIHERLTAFVEGSESAMKLALLFNCLSDWCSKSEKPIVLMIDEVDSATNNQVFLDFLAQLRGYFIHRKKRPTFQSVILSGVYDIKNLKRKISPDVEHKSNSPWNIAADFDVEMSFSTTEISEMLMEYENDYKTSMNIEYMANLIYDYTSGYPFLVSRICKIIDEKVTGTKGFADRREAWSKKGFLTAVNILQSEKNTLFESLVNKLSDFPELREIVYTLLFHGKSVPFNPLNKAIEIAAMFGFVKESEGTVVVANRVFETVLYNLFLSEEVMQSAIYNVALQNKNQFIKNGILVSERNKNE